MKKAFIVFLSITLLLSIQTGCRNDHGLDPKDPITLTLWHNYGGQMKETMDSMVDEFNETLGSEKGIIINVTSISSSNALHEKLVMIANGDAGAPDMPDIATANPKTAVILADKGLLTDLKTQFTQKELDAYLPRFLEEGTLGTDQLYIFPTAKSTEVTFLNKTVFDRFSKDTGASYEDLSTFEGIAENAALYYDWTDAQTPDIPNDGKAFYHSDSLFNLTQIGCRQLGSDFVKENHPDYSSDAFHKVWSFFFDGAVRGHFKIFDGYASDLFKTGEIICSTGSTAGVLFFDPVVTYPDNSTENVELMTLAYPTFQGGEKVAMQRGGGMIVSQTDETRAYAAGIFLKWFTNPGNNLRFVSSTGYLPVTEAAFGDNMTKEIDSIQDRNIQSLLRTSIQMQADYDFYIPPLFDGIDVLQETYNMELMSSADRSRAIYEELLKNTDKGTAFHEAVKDAFEKLQ
ncbi:MAG TPA: extracellular solute-binding protein [Anaerovoracaceae bacterium]|nr:extracellular solute-binding protein [Anaerovoracaceae bacterium]